MRGVLLVGVAVLAFAPVAWAQQRFGVTVEPGLDLTRQTGNSDDGAMGLLVPDAGPQTSFRRARATLLLGDVRNSLYGELPAGVARIRLTERPPAEAAEPRIYLGLPEYPQANDRRYVVIVRGPPYHRGLLTSQSTRIPGLVSIADIAPTALGEEDALGWEPHDNPIAYLRDLDDRIDDNGAARLPAAILSVALLALLAFVFPRAAVLGFATGAAANLALGVAAVSEPWLTIPAIGLGVLAAVPLALLLRSSVAIGLALAAVLACYLGAMAFDETWAALSPLGPTQNARFYGLSNLLETMLLVPALAAPAVLARRHGPLAFAAVAALALVMVAGSRFGADAGGAVVLGAGYAVLAAALLPRRAALAVLAALTAAVVLALVIGPVTHLSEADLPEALAERVELSWARAADGWGAGIVIAASLAALAVLVARGPRSALPLSFAAAIAVSLVVNDSPKEVALGGLVGYLALARWAESPRLQSDHLPPEELRVT